MAVVANRRSVMTLYSGRLDVFSHRVRIVLAEKGVSVDVLDIDPAELSEDLREINPYASTPTLVDRDLVLYQTDIITEYLDERFPHPPLMPVYPIARARTRLMIYRIDREWGPIIKKIETGKPAEAQAAARELRNRLVALAPLFGTSPFFMNEEFSLADCCIVPILWRLPQWGITLPSEATVISKYADRVFARESFQASLSEAEQDIRQPVSEAEIA